MMVEAGEESPRAAAALERRLESFREEIWPGAGASLTALARAARVSESALMKAARRGRLSWKLAAKIAGLATADASQMAQIAAWLIDGTPVGHNRPLIARERPVEAPNAAGGVGGRPSRRAPLHRRPSASGGQAVGADAAVDRVLGALRPLLVQVAKDDIAHLAWWLLTAAVDLQGRVDDPHRCKHLVDMARRLEFEAGV